MRLKAIAVAGVFLWVASLAGQGQSGVHTLTCGPEKTIGQAIKMLKPGDTLLVNGVCNENVVIGEEVHRITLDGQGSAAINADSSASAVSITGTGIIIRGFVITGGAPQGIAVTDGASAKIDSNTIQGADRNGITVFRNSSADIVSNTIQYSGLAGIAIQSTSSARIGWTGPPNNRVSLPNTIQNNGAQGIQVYRGSSAQIFTNTIQNNGSHGVFLDRNAQAEVAANTIAGNGGDGIRIQRNSGADIGTDATHTTPAFDDDTNLGANGGFGVFCTTDGFVDGRLGTFTGSSGAKSVVKGCFDNVLP
jgi:nitrous oxidase accessory protein NosD